MELKTPFPVCGWHLLIYRNVAGWSFWDGLLRLDPALLHLPGIQPGSGAGNFPCSCWESISQPAPALWGDSTALVSASGCRRRKPSDAPATGKLSAEHCQRFPTSTPCTAWFISLGRKPELLIPPGSASANEHPEFYLGKMKNYKGRSEIR